MVSNWLPSMSRTRCGTSIVATPSGASRIRIPATKSFTSGTCARTLFAATRSASPRSATSRSARSAPKKSTRVSTPRRRAASATLRAGSMPSAGLPGQVAIVTGAGRGVGRAIAEALAAEGAAVALAARSEPELVEVAARLGRAVTVPTDVGRAADVARLVETPGRELGPPTLLVAGAGTWDHVGPAWEGDPEAW